MTHRKDNRAHITHVIPRTLEHEGPPCEGAIPFVYLLPEQITEARQRGEMPIGLVVWPSEYHQLMKHVGAKGLADELISRIALARHKAWVSVEEFAEHIGRGRTAVYEMIKKGLPKAHGAGRGCRIPLAEADAWIKAGGLVQRKRRGQ